MEQQIHIYYLLNPETNKPFYIGATKTDLKARLKNHLNCNSNKRKLDIFNYLKTKKLKVSIVLIETVCVSDSGQREHFYYKLFTQLGFELVNDSRSFSFYSAGCLKKGNK